MSTAYYILRFNIYYSLICCNIVHINLRVGIHKFDENNFVLFNISMVMQFDTQLINVVRGLDPRLDNNWKIL